MKKWLPQPISDVELAFPAHVLDMMPKMEEMPEPYNDVNKMWGSRNKWVALFEDMFYSGLKGLKLAPKEGIDANLAWRHLRAIAGSFEPKHEHKTAAFAYLASEWFEDVTYEKAK